MASTRKKQDEKNLKTLRELVSLQHNKYCFDCNQRGVTYVNVTVGSFVCTKCSGILRGLTPPHRVKSISMATFTQEEIDLLKTRGNDYCQKVWMGLYEGPKLVDRDEHSVHTLMLDKYERKRYYLEPTTALRNNYNSNKQEVQKPAEVKPLTSIIPVPKPIKMNSEKMNGNMVNGINGINGGSNDFVADFAHADIFNAANNNVQTNTTVATTQPSFANFDNNPIFNNETHQKQEEEFSIFNLQFTNCGPVYNQIPLFPKMNINRWSSSLTSTPTKTNMTNGISSQSQPPIISNGGPPAPPEDRYAALKDLDNALKSQPTLDWNSAGSNSSLYSSSATPGSMYSSTTSSQSSSYGSPSQGQFMNLFSPQEPSNNKHNPFNTNSINIIWSTYDGGNDTWSNNANPFRFSPNNFGTSNNIQTPPINESNWTPNPFKVSNGHSNNPFL